MRLSFIFPTLLWLMLLLVPLWALALVGPRRLSSWRLWSSILLRTLALVALVLALAGAQLVRPLATTTTVFLLDGSESVALSQRARAEAFVQQALGAMPSDDRAGLVVFGHQALVERPPSDNRALGQVASRPAGGTTNIEDALQLGLALLPAEGGQRLVLLSDGGENNGNAAAAARIAAARGVPIDVVSLNGAADGLDAQLSRVELPASARAGQRLSMRIGLESSHATMARLRVEGPDGLLVDQQLQLREGAQDLELTLPEPQPRFNRYVVRLEAPGDARIENNAAEAYTFVSGQPRVLLVEGAPGAAANLAAALKAAQLDVSVVDPSHMPISLAELSAFEALALVDVPRRVVPDQTQAALSAYVHDLGRGLLMVGGPQSFGAGGWRESPVEAALPVSMDIPTHFRLPPVSIVVLVDVSGSMGQQEGSRTKLSLAAEGAQRIAALLRDEDELTVIPFDTQAGPQIGPLPGTQREEAIQALAGMKVGGGGIFIHDGLLAAQRALQVSNKPVRHVITLTDGADTEQQEGALDIVRQLRDAHVTLSSVAIGDGKDVAFLRQAAQLGAGRSFLTEQAANLPTILTGEAQAVIQPYILETDVTPQRGGPHPILRGVEQAPALHGYVLTTARQSAQVLLASPRGDPVLAAWQYGLGRSIAWTSDLTGKWGADWVSWDQFAHFSAQLVTWLLPVPSAQHLTLQADSSGTTLVLSAQALDPSGQPQTGLLVSARLVLSSASHELALHEVGPGLYRAAVSDMAPGAYLVQLVAQDRQGRLFDSVTAGVVVPRSAEYRSRGANLALLEQLVRLSGGRLNPLPTAAFDTSPVRRGAVREIGLALLWLALLLLPFDIATRRLMRHPARKRLAQPARVEPSGPAPDRPAGPVAGRWPQIGARSASQSADLEQLRAAQERARRRARGEE